jgi:hypothetical protein
MRYREIKESANNKLEKEIVDLLHSASNPGIISKAVEFLRNKVKKKSQDPKITPDETPIKTNTNEPNVQTDKEPVKENFNTLKQEAMGLVNGVTDEKDLQALLSFLRKNEIFELAHAAIEANISQGVKGNLEKKLGQLILDLNAPFQDKEEFLKHLSSGEGFFDGNSIVTDKTGNIYNKLTGNIAKEVSKPIALELRGKMGYGPDQGPGEFLLALTGKGVDLADKSDLILVNGKGVEVKADGTSINASGKTSRSGGRLYATSGYNGGTGARQYIHKILLNAGIPEPALDEFGWNGRTKGEKYKSLNFNKIGIDNFNNLIDQYKDKVDPNIKTQFLKAMTKGFYPDMPENLGKDFIANSIDNAGNIDYASTMREFVAMGHAYYKAKEGHDYIMIFNTESGNYVTIDTADDMRKALEQGVLKTNGGMDYFDDRSKGTPQLLTGNI